MTLRLHMMMCKYCSRYFDQIRALREIAQGYESTEVDPQGESQCLSPKARERISQVVTQAQQERTE